MNNIGSIINFFSRSNALSIGLSTWVLDSMDLFTWRRWMKNIMQPTLLENSRWAIKRYENSNYLLSNFTHKSNANILKSGTFKWRYLIHVGVCTLKLTTVFPSLLKKKTYIYTQMFIPCCIWYVKTFQMQHVTSTRFP